jgi:hypothetical protein
VQTAHCKGPDREKQKADNRNGENTKCDILHRSQNRQFPKGHPEGCAPNRDNLSTLKGTFRSESQGRKHQTNQNKLTMDSPSTSPGLTAPDSTKTATATAIDPGLGVSTVAQKRHLPALGVLGKIQGLSEPEQAEYMSCEMVLQMACRTFVEAGMALARIRDGQLYREEFDTFEQYYRAKWQFERTKVYCWMAAAEVFRSLSLLENAPKPEHESQLRPLFGLAPEQAQRAWQHAVSKASGRAITARLVKAAVGELQLAGNPQAKQIQARQERLNRRHLVTEGVSELLKLLMARTAHEVLIEKAAVLERHIRFLFPASRRKK